MLNAIKNIPAILAKVETMADNSLKFVLRSRDQECLSDEAIMYLVRNQGNELNVTLADGAIMFPRQGSKSQELRNIIMVRYEKSKEYDMNDIGDKDFDTYYDQVMNKLIKRMIENNAAMDADFIAQNTNK